MAELNRGVPTAIGHQPSAIFRIRLISAISLVYDGLVGIALLVAKPMLVQLFGVAPPQPPIFADLCGVFLVAVAAGYLIPYRDPRHGRSYLWVMGPFLKGMGATAFLLDYALRQSPASFLLFAVSDGTLALLTLWVLVSGRAAVPGHEDAKFT